MKILIAENSELTGFLVKSVLESQGHQVTLVLDGLSTFRQLHTESYDLVISEVLLPYYTGLEVLQMIRKNSGHAKTIILSTVQNLNTVYQAYQMQVDLYMTKPFDPDRLPQEIEKIKI